MNEPGFLGTSAALISDLSLLAYILLIVPAMLVGFVFARRKMFVPYHKMTMTAIVLLNWFIVAILMAGSYARGVAPYVSTSLGDVRVALPTVHLITGGVAQILGTYLVIRMWFENQLPGWFKVRRIKRAMRLTLILWLITAALGITTYFAFYTPTATAADPNAPVPAATEEAAVPGDAVPDPAATEEPSSSLPNTTTGAADAAPAAVTTEEVLAPVVTAEVDDDSGQGRGRGRGRGGDDSGGED